jgi:EAL domain-containing protein (putative c-di-GMP-specific phosphodiesterase class I)
LDGVRQALEGSGLDPRYLELELTEATVMRKVDEASKILEQIKKIGVSVSIDDFGTGYSSLSHLKRLPIDMLKIDQSFINDMSKNDDDVAIVTTIIGMAQTLDLKVVAEGVETEEQVSFLKNQDCDEIQGYLIGRPVSADNLISLFDRNLLPGASA